MQDPQEPVVNTETAAQANGGQDPQSVAPPAEPPQGQKTPEQEQEQVTKEEYEALQKELNKARMRENQLKNQQEAAERKRLEEANEYKSLYEQAQQRENEREARELLNSTIDSYPNETARQVAKNLLAKNPLAFGWNASEDGITADEAQAQVIQQLDALAESIGTPAPAPNPNPAPPVDQNNPLPGATNPSTETRIERIKRLEQELEGKTF